MGLEIIAKPGPIPREMMLRLRCDGDHGFLERFDIFEGAGFVELRAEATRMGWKETYVTGARAGRDGTKASVFRMFLCPECAGRSARGEDHD